MREKNTDSYTAAGLLNSKALNKTSQQKTTFYKSWDVNLKVAPVQWGIDKLKMETSQETTLAQNKWVVSEEDCPFLALLTKEKWLF